MRQILRRSFSLPLMVVAIAVISACSHTASTTQAGPRKDSSVMDTSDIRGHGFATVYDAISARHADWLLARGGPVSTQTPTLGVFIGASTRTVTVDYLRNLRPEDVREVRRLSATESLHTYSWPWGGLVITLR